jgi:flagellar basal-body rod modification protein FlgD
MQSMQVLAMGAQVGSNLMVATDHVTLGGAKVEGNIALAASSSKTTLVLTGADGVAHDIELGRLSPGNVPFSIDPAALGLAPGNYTMGVKTSSGETPAIDIAGKLNSVRLSPGGSTVLNVSGIGEVEPGADWACGACMRAAGGRPDCEPRIQPTMTPKKVPAMPNTMDSAFMVW